MEKRIYYHDTDAGKIVYYANYLKYMEEARTEYLEEKGLSVEEFRTRGLIYAVRKCSIAYKSPARYGDIILCSARITKITAAQIFFHQTITHKETGQLLVEGDVVLACLTQELKPVQIPEDLKARLT